MSPDSPEARLGRLETAVARLEQRTDDLSTDVRTLTPLIVQVAEIKITMAQVQTEARSTHKAVDDLRSALEQRQSDAAKDDKNFRRGLMLAGSTVVLSSLGTLILALIQGGHP